MSRAGRDGALLVAAAAIAGGGAVGIAYGAGDGLVLSAILAVCGATVVLLSHLLVSRRERIGSLSRQFIFAIALAFGLTLVGVGLIAVAMFESGHDAFLLAVSLAFAGALAAYSAAVVARGVMSDLESVRRGIIAVGDDAERPEIVTTGRDEIGELADRADSMIRKLDEREGMRAAAESARRELIAAVSHDLRTPLASLQVLSEAIEDGMVDDETRARYVGQMSFHIRSLGNLVDDLFELSRLEAGDVQWSMQQVRVDELIEETVEAMQPQAARKGVRVGTDLQRGLAPARANPEKLQRVLFNLIQNAIRHTPSDGSITVSAVLRDDGGSLEIEVVDTGEGIGADDRQRVFDPFFRGGSEEARTRKGAGLGLTICRGIVEAHGGRIWLDESDVGTRIRFTVPRSFSSAGHRALEPAEPGA